MDEKKRKIICDGWEKSILQDGWEEQDNLGWMRQCLRKRQSSKMDEKKNRIWKWMRNSVLDGWGNDEARMDEQKASPRGWMRRRVFEEGPYGWMDGRMDGLMDGATRSSTGRSHGRRLPRFLFSSTRTGRDGGWVGELWLVFLGKSSLRERSFCLLQRFSYVVFCNPNRREGGGGRHLIVCRLNFTLTYTLAYRLLFFL